MSNKALLTLIAAAALAASTPALAQSYGRGHDNSINQRQAQLEQRVERMTSNGALSRSEYRVFQRQFDNVRRLERSYRRDGLSQWERRELNAQLDRIQGQIRYERADNRRDNRWDHRNDRRW